MINPSSNNIYLYEITEVGAVIHKLDQYYNEVYSMSYDAIGADVNFVVDSDENFAYFIITNGSNFEFAQVNATDGTLVFTKQATDADSNPTMGQIAISPDNTVLFWTGSRSGRSSTYSHL